jgi:hypothetical protein
MEITGRNKMDRETLQVPRELLLLGGAVECGLFDALRDMPADTGYLARKLNLDQRALWIVAEALLSLGYLECTDQGYTLSPEAKDMFYNPQSPAYTGFAFMHRYEMTKKWLNLPQSLRTGRPIGKDREPATRSHFIEAMAVYARPRAASVAELCLAGLPAGARVLDIGGGPLTYARAFAGRGANVTVLDLPEVVEMMQSTLLPGENIRMVAGDFTVGLPAGPFDMAYLGNICHIYNESGNRALFKRVAANLVHGGYITIAEFVRGRHPFAALFAITMLVSSEIGNTWTWEEYTSWLEEAGFGKLELLELGDRQIIKGVKI